MVLDIARSVKNALLPMGPAVRRLPLGIARALSIEIDFRHHSGLYLGLYEIELNSHLKRLCYPGARCFDVGGHIGYDALVLACLSRNDVITFESDERLCAAIRRTVAANPEYSQRITVVQGFVDETSSAAGVISLDEFVSAEGGGLPDFMKIDVEGAEARVLRGAERILMESQPNLIVETHGLDVEQECISILQNHRYTPVTVNSRRWLPDNRPGQINRWVVCEGGPKRASPRASR